MKIHSPAHQPDLAIAVEWTCTLVAAVLWIVSIAWYEFPNVTPTPVFRSRSHMAIGLLLIGVMLTIRWFRAGFLFRRTTYDIPIALFLLGAFLGWLCAYNRELGLLRLCFLLIAISVYYLLADSGPLAIGRCVFGLVVLAVLLALLFIVWHESAAGRTPFAGFATGLAPRLGSSLPHPNTVAGILSIAVPFVLKWIGLAFSTSAIKEVEIDSGLTPDRPMSRFLSLLGRISKPGAALLVLTIIAIGLFLTGSRGAWLALSAAVLLWCVRRGSRLVSLHFLRDAQRARHLETGVVILFALLGFGLLATILAFQAQLSALPGGESMKSYLDLYRNAFYLAQDYPFTGVGFGAFQMVYSTYSLLIHVGFVPDAHNLFLQVWLEQGLLGICALLWIVGLSMWMMLRDGKTRPWYAQAAGWATVIVFFHGVTDAALYGNEPWSTIFLFVPLGFSVSTPVSPGLESCAVDGASGIRRHPVSVYRAVALFVLLTALSMCGRPLLSMTLSNLGAVEQTRAVLEVYSWPEWPLQDEVRHQVNLSRAEAFYGQALEYDDKNPTANRRMGMIALSRGEYAKALQYLEVAFVQTPSDNATRQLLGEACLVNGRWDEGVSLWSNVQDDQNQLGIRSFWYRYIGDVKRWSVIEEAVQTVRNQR